MMARVKRLHGEVNVMSKKALIIDNDFFFLEFLTDLLEARGYQVIKAYDVKEGIARLEEEKVDLLFVDMIMPKIDGKQVIRFTRSRFPKPLFPIIALSIIEEMDGTDEIEADYFLAKGPVEKMTTHIETLIDKVEREPIPAHSGERVFLPENLIPRQITGELIETLNFQKAIMESVGVGILVLDRDARIITANALALDTLGRSFQDVLNRQVVSIFPKQEKAKIIDALKKMLLQSGLRKVSFFITVNAHEIGTVISLLKVNDETVGWVIALCLEPGVFIDTDEQRGMT
jgi:PAS domain S-box-containing protein